jgi:parallel beta-helix repeat protein
MKNTNKKNIFMILSLTFLLTMNFSSAANNFEDDKLMLTNDYNLYVDDDFNSTTPGWNVTHFSRVQDAIDIAVNKDRIKVYEGVYYEHLCIEKPLTLEGNINGDPKPVINGCINGYKVDDVIFIGEKNRTGGSYLDFVYFRGFEICHSGETADAGIFVSFTNSFEITDNIIRNNYRGIYIHHSEKDAKISRNHIKNNVFGVVFEDVTSGGILDNIIEKNMKYGIGLDYCRGVTIDGNTIRENEMAPGSSGAGLVLARSSKNEIKNNDFIGNNKLHALFIDGKYNSWHHNYWDNRIFNFLGMSLPWKPIIGWHTHPLLYQLPVPRILNFDISPNPTRNNDD